MEHLCGGERDEAEPYGDPVGGMPRDQFRPREDQQSASERNQEPEELDREVKRNRKERLKHHK